mmetsp:Transcript_18499/g.24825  ORF Transcript_18499/g.24825 Transcript_18499/m.24825 type:complete len:111 (+) Transcript_18499:516-848(+)
MFLDTLLKSAKEPETVRALELIISQLNLLLCLVQDVLDIKTIESKKFERKFMAFEPTPTLEFIVAMFNPHCSMSKTVITFDTVSVATLQHAFSHNHREELMPHEDLPAKL